MPPKRKAASKREADAVDEGDATGVAVSPKSAASSTKKQGSKRAKAARKNAKAAEAEEDASGDMADEAPSSSSSAAAASSAAPKLTGILQMSAPTSLSDLHFQSCSDADRLALLNQWEVAAQPIEFDPEATQASHHIIRRGDDPVGIISTSVTAQCLFVDNIWVRPSRQRQGVGRRTIPYLLQLAIAASRYKIGLKTESDNPGAAAFWKAMGALVARREAAATWWILPLCVICQTQVRDDNNNEADRCRRCGTSYFCSFACKHQHLALCGIAASSSAAAAASPPSMSHGKG